MNHLNVLLANSPKIALHIAVSLYFKKYNVIVKYFNEAWNLRKVHLFTVSLNNVK